MTRLTTRLAVAFFAEHPADSPERMFGVRIV